jgi:hypothetical protein
LILFADEVSMTDAEIHTRAIIAAALIQSRTIDPEGLASGNKAISEHKLGHLRDLTERIYSAIAADRESRSA